MKRGDSWLTLLFAAIALATLSRGFIFRLVCGDFVIGILLVVALFIPQLLEWVWHLPLRPIDVIISCDPLKPSTSEFCRNIREVFRRAYSDGGKYLVYIVPMPNTGMRFAFNLVKQRIEAKCGSELYPSDESSYQLPSFSFDDSPVVYRISNGMGEASNGVFLKINAKRGSSLKLSKLHVNKYAFAIADILILLIGILLKVWPIILGAILLRKAQLSNLHSFWRYSIILISIVVIMWRTYHFYW